MRLLVAVLCSLLACTVRAHEPEAAPQDQPEAGATVSTGPTVPGGQSPVFVVPPKVTYPKESRRLGEQGRMYYRVLVNEEGDAEAVGLFNSSGFFRLDDAALAAVARAKYVPARKNGVIVRSYCVGSINFVLE